MLYSCSSVKFVPDDNYLLNKVEIEIDNEKLDKESARSYIRQKENYKILGFAKFHLIFGDFKKTDRMLFFLGSSCGFTFFKWGLWHT